MTENNVETPREGSENMAQNNERGVPKPGEKDRPIVRQLTDLDQWVENWKRYCRAVGEENKRRLNHNRQIQAKTNERLKPRQKKFLWWTWMEEPSWQYRSAQYRMESIFTRRPMVPTMEGFMDWLCSGETKDPIDPDIPL